MWVFRLNMPCERERECVYVCVCVFRRFILQKNNTVKAVLEKNGAGALGRPRGMGWGGRREEGGGFGMGNTCIPVAD